MGYRNTKNLYGSVAKTFHWLTFILIVGMLSVGYYMAGMDNSPDKFALYGTHKSIGVVVLLVVVLRLLWRSKNSPPELPLTLARLQRLAAQVTHLMLYLLMIAMPLSGWLMSSAAGFPVSVFGWFTLPDLVSSDRELFATFSNAHETIALLMIAFVLLHVAAALLHHFYYGDNVLKRMLPYSKRNDDAKDIS